MYWINIHQGGRRSLELKRIMYNLFIMAVIGFFTTPEVIIEILSVKSLLSAAEEKHLLPPKLRQVAPVYTSFIITAVLPVIIALADRKIGKKWSLPFAFFAYCCLVGHWTRSGEHTAIMTKAYYYLVFTVIVLPTFGLSSIYGFVLSFGK